MTPPPTLGVILAGGLSRRMGGQEKSLLIVGGQTLLDHVRERLAPQCESLILNANGSSSRFDTKGLPVVPDVIPGHQGPLAGILTALEWTAVHHPFTRPTDDWLESFAADPGNALAYAYDLIVNGNELGGGSFRIHEIDPDNIFRDLLHRLVRREADCHAIGAIGSYQSFLRSTSPALAGHPL